MNIGNRKKLYFRIGRERESVLEGCLSEYSWKGLYGVGDENTRLSGLARYVQTEKAEKELSLLYPSVQFDRNTRSGVRRRPSVDSETSDHCELECSHVDVGAKTIFQTQQLQVWYRQRWLQKRSLFLPLISYITTLFILGVSVLCRKWYSYIQLV